MGFKLWKSRILGTMAQVPPDYAHSVMAVAKYCASTWLTRYLLLHQVQKTLVLHLKSSLSM